MSTRENIKMRDLKIRWKGGKWRRIKHGEKKETGQSGEKGER